MGFRVTFVAGLLIAGGFAACPALGDEGAIVAGIEEFFRADDSGRRAKIVARIEADPDYDRKRLSGWLHRADLFEPLKPGRMTIRVPLANGRTRSVVLRIPEGYDHHKPWPLIYALHGSGGDGDGIIGYVRSVLGARIDEYIVAAPDRYDDLIIHHTHWPPVGEHPAAWLKIKQTVHVNSDRVYVTGYSLGGHTTWTLAVLHADQFAAAMPLASTFTLMLADLMWESFVPNLGHLPLLCVWGDGDTHYGGERISPEGGIAGVNRALRDLLATRKLPATMIELAGVGHSDVVPPGEELRLLLAQKRVHTPRSFEHTFRHIYQGQAYWLEGLVWTGGQWTDKQHTIRFREGEDPNSDADFDQAAARTYRGLLGKLSGRLEGQEIRVSRRKVKELAIWIHEGMINWNEPVTVNAGGRRAFEGRVEPSLHVCLLQAARTWDFDRLRWAGLRVTSRKTRVVTPEMRFPALGEWDGASRRTLPR